MKYYLTIFVLLFSLNFCYSKDSNILEKNKKPEITFILKTTLGNCMKCVVVSFSTFEKIKNEFINQYDIKFISYLICDRDKEIKLFRKQYDFADSVIKYKKGMLPKKIDESGDMLFILNKNNELLISFGALDLTDFGIVKEKIEKAIKDQK